MKLCKKHNKVCRVRGMDNMPLCDEHVPNGSAGCENQMDAPKQLADGIDWFLTQAGIQKANEDKYRRQMESSADEAFRVYSKNDMLNAQIMKNSAKDQITSMIKYFARSQK